MPNARPPLTDQERAAVVARIAASPLNRRFTDDQIESMHSLGCSYYGHGQYETALPLFLVSSRFRPADTRLMMALGACHQAMKNFATALQTFQLVQAIEPGHGDARLQSARCLLGLDEGVQARAMLADLAQSPSAGNAAKKAASLLRMLAH